MQPKSSIGSPCWGPMCGDLPAMEDAKQRLQRWFLSSGEFEECKHGMGDLSISNLQRIKDYSQRKDELASNTTAAKVSWTAVNPYCLWYKAVLPSWRHRQEGQKPEHGNHPAEELIEKEEARGADQAWCRRNIEGKYGKGSCRALARALCLILHGDSQVTCCNLLQELKDSPICHKLKLISLGSNPLLCSKCNVDLPIICYYTFRYYTFQSA